LLESPDGDTKRLDDSTTTAWLQGDTWPVTARYVNDVAALRAAVLDGAGMVDPAIRRAAGTGTTVPEVWAAYVSKVRDASYTITDHDVSALKAAGCTEEEIFEITVAAATGAALQRLDIGLRAMHGEP
jgi:alkylhydroperoxidase family enzyme